MRKCGGALQVLERYFAATNSSIPEMECESCEQKW